MNPIRVFIIDDHLLVREGLVAVLAQLPGVEVVGQAETAEDGIDACLRLRPQVVLMDLNLPGMSGPEAITLLRVQAPEMRLIALTSYETEGDISRALDAGAHGYLLKTTTRADLQAAIAAVAAGGQWLSGPIRKRFEEAQMWRQLTPKEFEVLENLTKGLSNKEIAVQMGTAESTIKTHMHSLLQKLGAADRAEAVALAVSERVIRLD